jgi:two-component sensor histidine kinase
VQSVSVDQYLAALVEDLAKTDTSATPALSLAAEPIDLDPDRAVAIGVIVNELVLNAMKYAYPEEKGPIRIGLKRVNGKRAMLSVEDDGIGHDIKTLPRSTGLGRSIVGAMASRLGADVVYDQAHSGTRVVITFECTQPPAA